MNANFGIVLRSVDRRTVLLPLAPNIRTWGDQIVEDDTDRYTFRGLDDVEFQVYPVTKFILSRLPASERTTGLEYAWMTGVGLDKYELWVKEGGTASQCSSFERGFVALLSKLRFWAVMFAPEGDRLAMFVTVGPDEMIGMLRGAVRDVTSSDGFLAIGKDASV